MKLQSVLVLLLSTSVLGFPYTWFQWTVTEDDANVSIDQVEEGVNIMSLAKNNQSVIIDKVEEGVTEIDIPIEEVELSSEKDESESLGILNNVVELLTKGSNIQNRIIGKVANSVVKIEKLMKDVEVKLNNITKEGGVINTERSKNLRKAYKAYGGIKVTLKDARVELKRFQVNAELKLNDILVYVEAWDHEKYSIQDQKMYLKELVVLVKQLFEDSKVILADVKDKYQKTKKAKKQINRYLDFETINEKPEIIEWYESLKHAESYIDEATEENFYGLTWKWEQYKTNMERLLDAALEINSQPNINIVEKDLADSNNSGK